MRELGFVRGRSPRFGIVDSSGVCTVSEFLSLVPQKLHAANFSDFGALN